MSDQQQNRHLAAILVADVVGYSRLMREDEEATVAVLKKCVAIFREAVQSHGGRIVNAVGDCVVAEFPSAVRAVESSILIQQRLEQQAEGVPESRQMRFRIGLNTGDVISEGEMLYGDGVNVAARMETLADPGGICLSDAVHSQVKDKLDGDFEFVGKRKVKNIEDPIGVYRLYAPGTGPPRPASARWRKPATWSAALALVAVLVAGLIYWQGNRVETVELRPVDNTLPSLVLLPFANSGNDPEQEYLADGVIADITTDLSRLDSLRVISRQAAATYRNQKVEAQQVGRELGVNYVLEGSLQKAGNRLRVNVRLVNAKDNHLIWGERFDRNLDDIFAVQDEIAGRIVKALSIELTDEEQQRIARRYTQNVEAYEWFLRGQQAYVRQNAQDNTRAQEYFRKAVGLDPSFARAYAALALTYSDDWRFGWSENSELGEQQALRWARHAIDLDDALPEAYWVLGFVQVFRGEYDEAIRAASRAVKLDPNNSDAYVTLAISTNFAGDPEKAIELMRHAMALNPHYGSRYSGVLALSYYQAGRYEEALAAFNDSLERNPERIPPYLYRAVIFTKMGRKDDAEWEVEKILSINPDFTTENIARVLPFNTPALLKDFVDSLRQAGLPDSANR